MSEILRNTGGVNIELGDEMSKMFHEASTHTYGNIPGFPDAVVRSSDSSNSFRGIDGAIYSGFVGDLIFDAQADGIGTKPTIRQQAADAGRENAHFGSAFDLFAMVLDDAGVRGSQPVMMHTILDVAALREDKPKITEGMRQLSLGMVAAAEVGGVVVLGGEIAELGFMVGGRGDFKYNWCGVATTITHKERVLDGSRISAGDAVIGFVERGFRSNGITDVRDAITKAYGKNWHRNKEATFDGIPLIDLVQEPATMYTPLMTDLTGGFDPNRSPKAGISGAAHITGGGMPSKIGRMLEPTNKLGITIGNPIQPPQVMSHVQELAGFEDRYTYGRWHMGPGMIVTADYSELGHVLAAADEHGIEAQLIGDVTDEPGLRIINKGMFGRQDEYHKFDVDYLSS